VHDEHPDAHATRLQFMVAAGYAEVPGWDIEADLLAYVSKYFAVSANCRVTLEAELRLLGGIKSDSGLVLSAGGRCNLHNRAVALRAVTSHLHQHKSLRCGSTLHTDGNATRPDVALSGVSGFSSAGGEQQSVATAHAARGWAHPPCKHFKHPSC
jgi:hypothetical protein